jgi:hypothetical protein
VLTVLLLLVLMQAPSFAAAAPVLLSAPAQRQLQAVHHHCHL